MAWQSRTLLVAAVTLLAAAGGVVVNWFVEWLPRRFATGWQGESYVVAMLVGFAVIALYARHGVERRRSPAHAALGSPVSVLESVLGRPTRGRAAELARLGELAGSRRPSFAVVCGAGGLGKTTLAAEAAAAALAAGSVVFCVDYTSPAGLAADVTDVALATGLPLDEAHETATKGGDVAGMVWSHLDRTPGWVLVVDGLDHPAELDAADGPLPSRREWIRPTRNGLLIITSRTTDPLAWGPDAALVELRPLPVDVGADVLLDIAPAAVSGSPAEAPPTVVADETAGDTAAPSTGDPATDPTRDTATRPAGDTAAHSTGDPVIRPVSDLTTRPTGDLAAVELARRLGAQPLALSVAAQHIAQPTSTYRTFDAYRHAFTARAADPVATVDPAAQPDATDPGVARALAGGAVGMALDQLAADGHPDARPLLRLASLLAAPPAPRALLTAALVEAATGRATTTAALDAATAGLQRHGLVDLPSPDSTGGVPTITLNPLVRDATAADLGDAERAAMRAALDAALAAHVARVADAGASGWNEAELLAPHVLTQGALTDDGPGFTAARDTADLLGDTLVKGGRRSAVALYEQILVAVRRHRAADHADVVEAHLNLGSAYLAVERHVEAIALLEQTLATYQRTHDPDSDHILTARNALAVSYRYVGRGAESIAMHEQNLAAFERTLGPDHENTLTTRNNLAAAYRHAGRTTEAIALHEVNVAASERVRGPEHPDTLVCHFNLGITYLDADRGLEAVALLQRTLAARERVLGPDHPDTMMSREVLAVAGTWAEVSAQSRRSRRARKAAGSGDPAQASTRTR